MDTAKSLGATGVCWILWSRNNPKRDAARGRPTSNALLWRIVGIGRQGSLKNFCLWREGSSPSFSTSLKMGRVGKNNKNIFHIFMKEIKNMKGGIIMPQRYTKEWLEELCSNSYSYAEVLRKAGRA